MVYCKSVYFLLLFFTSEVCLVSCDSGKEVRCEVRTRIESGWICGKVRLADDGSDYVSFRGIPYARQPVGNLRFKELRRATPWNHYLDATEERPVCPQHEEIFGRLMRPVRGMSEACIYANVHVPLIKAFENDNLDQKEVEKEAPHHEGIYDRKQEYSRRNELHLDRKFGFPILVYIHGGGFQVGSGDSDLYGPEYLVSRGVIVITFNYRINVFGFLSLNSPKIPGNQGLRDQLTLLRWVQRNARAFGGDPDDVTLMGQSAGATAAHLLSLSKHADGLFQRAILSSGTANPGFYTTSPLFAKLIATMFLSELGINSTDSDEIYDQLVKIPLNRILLANSAVQYKTGLISFSPVVETAFPGVTRIIEDDPTELIKKGYGRQYPLIIGFNTAECENFRPRLVYLNMLRRIEANPTMLLSPRIVFRTPPNVSLQLAREVLRRYFKRRLTYNEIIRSCSETFFEYPSFELANLRASTEGAPVFLYQYSYESELSFVKEALWLKYRGTTHEDDLIRMFRPNAIIQEIGNKTLPWKDELIKDWMTNFVINFMRCSKPVCNTLKPQQSPWLAVQKEWLNYQDINEPGVYRNSKLTPRQRDMIDFFEYIEQESTKAITAEGSIRDGTATAEVLMSNMTGQLVYNRPRYSVAIVYRPKAPSKKFIFKELH